MRAPPATPWSSSNSSAGVYFILTSSPRIFRNRGAADLRAACVFARKRRLGPYSSMTRGREQREKELATLGRAGFGYAIARKVVDAETIEDLLAAVRLSARMNRNVVVQSIVAAVVLLCFSCFTDSNGCRGCPLSNNAGLGTVPATVSRGT